MWINSSALNPSFYVRSCHMEGPRTDIKSDVFWWADTETGTPRASVTLKTNRRGTQNHKFTVSVSDARRPNKSTFVRPKDGTVTSNCTMKEGWKCISIRGHATCSWPLIGVEDVHQNRVKIHLNMLQQSNFFHKYESWINKIFFHKDKKLNICYREESIQNVCSDCLDTTFFKYLAQASKTCGLKSLFLLLSCFGNNEKQRTDIMTFLFGSCWHGFPLACFT